MNKIEQMFYDAVLKVSLEKMHNVGYQLGMGASEYIEAGEGCIYFIQSLEAQKPIGIYKADFLFTTDYKEYVVEIDGHDYHKTKEQRFCDYKRERFFYSEGKIVFRFMASEVYVDAENCARWVLEMIEKDVLEMTSFEIKAYDRGIEVANKNDR